MMRANIYTDTVNNRRGGYKNACLMLALSLSLLVFSCGLSAAENITVIYPVYNNDADKIIDEIRGGIKSRARGRANEVSAHEIKNKKDLIQSFGGDNSHALIALTSDVSQVIQDSSYDGPIIEGISELNSNTNKGTLQVGIQASPSRYIDALKILHPNINRIHYFYNSSENNDRHNELFRYAEKAGIKIELIPVGTLGDTMSELSRVIKLSIPDNDALWIPGSLLRGDGNTALKFLLREAWMKSLLVYSDSLDVVMRGLLFTLVPDYRAYGELLAEKAMQLSVDSHDLNGGDQLYFDDVYMMINQRFAIHLGVEINREKLPKYRIVMPAK